MERHINQVVPSASCDWLNQYEEERGNQVVPSLVKDLPGTIPTTLEKECDKTSTMIFHPKQHSACVQVLAASLEALSLEGVQVVPSMSKSPTVDGIAMDVEAGRIFRSADSG